MTGQQIYELASSFLYEKDAEDEDSKIFSVGFLNVLLQEALPIENSIRRYNEQAELSNAPLLIALAETVPYADAITRTALPYGVASFLYQEAVNDFQAENYRAKYIGALSDAKKYIPELIVNAYVKE